MKTKWLCTTAGWMLFLSLLAPLAHAVVVEIPLPGLLGDYPLSESNGTRTTTFHLPQAPSVIHSASFRISGTAVLGSANCDEFGDGSWAMEYFSDMKDASLKLWLSAPHPPVIPSGPFGWTAPFSTSDGATWDFLMDGEGEISLYGAPTALLGLCQQGVVPSGTVTEAVLIIDAEFPVATEPSTWGRIKALYR
jgi:hypothetical protein